MIFTNPIVSGFLISFICLIPGVGIGHILLLSSLNPEAIPYAITSSLVINSIKEASIPALSGSINTMSIDNLNNLIVDPYKYFNNLLKNKVIGWFVGLIIGCAIPDVMFNKNIIIFILLCLLVKCKIKELISFIIWIIFIFIIYSYTDNYFVLVTSIIIYNIPELLKIRNRNNNRIKVERFIDDISVVNYGLLVVGSFISLASPGLASSTIFSQLNGDNASTGITASVSDIVIEAAGLALLTRNISNGKSLIGDYLAIGDYSLIIRCTGIMLISVVITSILSKYLIRYYKKEQQELTYISVIINCILIISLDKNAIILIILGLIISLLLSKLECPKNLKGFTFTIPIIF